MNIVLGIIIGIIVLTILVVVHELGHALVAKRYGVKVEEFGIGFPPKIWGIRRKKSLLGNNVLFSINLLPLGGFVRLQGEHDNDKAKGDYGAATFWQKTQILLAGVAVNWVVAVLLLTVLAVVGMPKIMKDQFYIASDAQIVKQPVELVAVTKDMPAERAGLRPGDKIVRFDGGAVASPIALSQMAAERKGKTVDVVYTRGNVERTAQVALKADNSDKKGYLGASPTQQELIRATWSAPLVGVGTTLQMTWVTLEGLGQVVAKGISGLAMKLVPDGKVQQQANKNLAAVGDSVAGPVSIFGILFPAAEKAGMTYVIMMSAIISLTLAVMNALPIPALDGGRWFVTWLFRLMKKPLRKELEEKIHGTGFMILMALVILVTIADIGKLKG